MAWWHSLAPLAHPNSDLLAPRSLDDDHLEDLVRLLVDLRIGEGASRLEALVRGELGGAEGIGRLLVVLLVAVLPLVVLLRDELGGVAHGDASQFPADSADGHALDLALGAEEHRADFRHMGLLRR